MLHPSSEQMPSWFLKVALFWGTVWVLLVPPFQSPDEVNHFLRAWQISNGNWRAEKTPDARLGGQLPATLADFRDGFYFLKNQPDTCLSPAQIFNKMPLLPSEEVVFFDFPNTAIYPPTAYVPQVLAIAAAKIARLPLIITFYLTRFINLLVWAMVVAAALCLLPRGRMWMSALALLPASLVIAATANADVLTNALCFWIIAYVLSNTSDQTASSSTKPLILIILFIIISINKVVLAPFTLLIFLPRFNIFNFGFEKKLCLVVAVWAAAAAQAWYANQLFIPFDEYHAAYRGQATLNEGVHPAGQLQWIAQHAGEFVATVVRSFVEALPSLAAHIVGKFGWEKNYLPAWVIAGLWCAIGLAIGAERMPLSRQQRWWLISIAFACFLLFCVSNFCLWHAVGSTRFHNFQGRYFAPLLPLLAAAAGSLSWVKGMRPFQKWLPRLVVALLLLGQVSLLISILNRYFCFYFVTG